MNTSSRTGTALVSLSFIILSLTGLGLLVVLTFTLPRYISTVPWQPLVIGTLFALICLLGVVAALAPSYCSRFLHFTSSRGVPSEPNGETSPPLLQGHHPVCDNYSSHVLELGGKRYCAGCTGLLVGALFAVFGSFLYFFADCRLDSSNVLVFWLGVVGVASGVLQYHVFRANSGLVHTLQNVFFVVGACFLLIGTDALTHSFPLEAYLLALVIFWIATRIILSQQEHEKICATCGLNSCPMP